MRFFSFVLASTMLSLVASSYRPVVQMHGMGDNAKNPAGMVPMGKRISKVLNGTYVTNVAIDGGAGDTLNGFFCNLDDSVEKFRKVVQADKNLKDGFNAIGYSQGNLIIRGYIERYNNPRVYNFVSVHGPHMGVSSLPHCTYSATICQQIAKLLTFGAYNSFVQKHLAQANYYRDPKQLEKYLKTGLFLADVNNERSKKNETYKKNFSSLEKLVLVKATDDGMVMPNDSEWFGYYKDSTSKEKWQMEETPWYQGDWFGLKTLAEAGKIELLTTPGDHLDFDIKDLDTWVTNYFKGPVPTKD